jgi:serralysin
MSEVQHSTAWDCACGACVATRLEEAFGAGNGVDGAASAVKPILTLSEVATQLRTQWGGAQEGKTWTWLGTSNVSYSIPNSGPSGQSESAGYVAMTALMQDRARLAFELWDDVIAISLNESVNNPNANITFNYSSQTDGGGTYAYWNGHSAGNNFSISRAYVWLNSGWSSHNQDSDMFFGGYGFITYLHEIGHTLGLSHPGTYNAGQGTLSYANSAEYFQDSRKYTVMSYWDADEAEASVDHYGQSGAWMYAAAPLLHDIAAAQAAYGADMTTRTGNTVYGFNSNAGRDVFDFTKNQNPIVAIWDAGGTDTLDGSGYSTAQVIDLNPGSFSSMGYMTDNIAIAYGATIENAIGGSGNDRLIGNAVANRLDGRAGNDTLTGNAASDVFVFWDGYGSDTITDFVITGATDDEIDVSGLTLVSTFDDILGYASQVGANAVFNFGSGLVLTLWDVAVTSLTYDDFWFGASAPPPGPNEAPADVALSNLSIAENATGGVVGNVLVTDADNTAFAFLVSDARFQIAGTPGAYQLRLVSGVSLDYETEASVALVITATDSGGLSKDQNFTVNVLDMQGVTITGTSSGNTIDATHAPSGQSFSTLENDTIYGMAGNDVIHGLAGNDTLTGGAGTDKIYAGNGDDTLVVSGGNDTSDVFDGGAGTDTIVVGGTGSLTLAGFNAGTSSVEAWQGNGQAVLGNSSGNVLDFSALASVSGLLYVDGGSGNDTLRGSNFADDLRGGSGNDTLYGNSGDDILTGGSGTDRLYASNGDDTLAISGSNDTSDIFDGGADTDTIVVTGTGSVTLAGFNATSSSIEIWQGNGQGVIGNSSANVFDFSGLSSVSGLLYVDAGSGNDTVTGSNFADDLRGGSGNDTLNGGDGNDALAGGSGNDTLNGGANDDTITGGAGRDTMTGGAGADTFIFTATSESPSSARDTIMDFVAGTDKIDLHAIDANTASGAAGNQDFFFFGSSPIAVAHQVTFTQAGGNTIVSADTNGNSTADIVIVLTGLHTLTQDDFIL